jgi:hypothetical protein
VSQPTPTPTPTIPPEPPPPSALDLACSDITTPAAVRTLIGDDVRSVDPLFEGRGAMTGIPSAADPMSRGGIACVWSNLKPQTSGRDGTPGGWRGVRVTVVPDSKVEYENAVNPWQTYGEKTPSHSESCSTAYNEQCVLRRLIGSTYLSVQLAGPALAEAGDAAAERLAKPFVDEVEKLVRAAKPVATAWKPDAQKIPAGYSWIISPKNLQLALGAVAPIGCGIWEDEEPPAPAAHAAQTMRTCYYIGRGPLDAGTISVLPAGEWAWDAIGAVRPDRWGAQPVTIDHAAPDDEAWIAQDGIAYALDLIHLGNWYHVEWRGDYPGAVTPDIPEALRRIGSAIIQARDRKTVTLPTLPSRDVPQPSTAVTLDRPTYDPSRGPNPIRQLSCSDFGSDLDVSRLLGFPVGTQSQALTSWQTLGDGYRLTDIADEYDIRAHGGSTCLWRDDVPDPATLDREQPLSSVASVTVEPMTPDEWHEYDLNYGGPVFCDAWASFCSGSDYANGQAVSFELRGMFASTDMEKRATTFFDRAVGLVTHAKRVEQRFVPRSLPGSLGDDACLVSDPWVAKATGVRTATTVRRGYLQHQRVTCSLSDGTDDYSTNRIGEISYLPGGSWAWAEIGAKQSAIGTPQPYAVAGLQPTDKAFIRYDDSKPWASVDLILSGSWIEVTIAFDRTVKNPSNALRVLAEQIVRKASA